MSSVDEAPEARNPVEFTVQAMSRSSCSSLNRMRATLELEPIYQRQGNIWSRANKQLFIDSLINGVDIPKIYLHDGDGVAPGKKYAIIDGKQRLEAIFDFYDDKFPLADRFELFNSTEVRALSMPASELAKLGGKYYSQLDRDFSQVARILDGCVLSVMVVETDDLEAIEEMFSRLNDAVPLNAAEKRQAVGDPMRAIVRAIAGTEFFADRLPFSNRRFRHFDAAAKFVKWALAVLEGESWETMSGAKLDVKRAQLDRMFEQAKSKPSDPKWTEAKDLVLATLESLAAQYHKADQLLASVGTLSVLFLDGLRSTRFPEAGPALDRATVTDFENFRRSRENLDPENSEDIVGALTIAEYNRLTQSPNDGSALKTRLDILDVYANALRTRESPLAALSRADLID